MLGHALDLHALLCCGMPVFVHVAVYVCNVQGSRIHRLAFCALSLTFAVVAVSCFLSICTVVVLGAVCNYIPIFSL